MGIDSVYTKEIKRRIIALNKEIKEDFGDIDLGEVTDTELRMVLNHLGFIDYIVSKWEDG